MGDPEPAHERVLQPMQMAGAALREKLESGSLGDASKLPSEFCVKDPLRLVGYYAVRSWHKVSPL